MKFKFNRYHAKDNTLGFDKYGTSAWITVFDWKELFGEERPPIYVKLTCTFPSPFTFYSKINVLNPDSGLGKKKGYLTLPYEAINHSFLIGRDSMVEVSKIDVSKCRVAESITIQLPKNNNTYWSISEKNRVEENMRQQFDAVFTKQCLYLFPETKEPTLGIITGISPASSHNDELWSINENTSFIFENLRTDQEQVLDLKHIGGLGNILSKLRKIIQIPMNHPEYYLRFGIERPKGLLLYGPPGNGKTTIAKALAKSLGGASFIEVKMTEVWASHVGDGERRLEEYFKEAEKIGNCIIFLDEIDAIAKKRNADSPGYETTLVGTLLSLMDGLNSNSKVFVIGATNRRNAIDPAFRRPGRFDLEEEIPLPATASAREDIMTKIIPLNDKSLFDISVTSQYIDSLAESTIGYSGADLKQLYREAAMSAISNSIGFDDEGKEILLKDANETIISSSDFERAKMVTTPTPLRGLEIQDNSKAWNEIIALDSQKKTMEELHQKLAFYTSKKKLQKRWSSCNVFLYGPKGSGKSTFLHSFSKEFGYELLYIDFLEITSIENDSHAFRQISELFNKARQLGKALILLKNIDKLQNPQKYLPYIFNENNKISKHLPLFTVLVCETDSLKDHILGYGKFSVCLDFNVESSVIKEAIKKKYQNPSLEWNCGNNVGEVISTIEELLIEKEYQQQ